MVLGKSSIFMITSECTFVIQDINRLFLTPSIRNYGSFGKELSSVQCWSSISCVKQRKSFRLQQNRYCVICVMHLQNSKANINYGKYNQTSQREANDLTSLRQFFHCHIRRKRKSCCGCLCHNRRMLLIWREEKRTVRKPQCNELKRRSEMRHLLRQRPQKDPYSWWTENEERIVMADSFVGFLDL